MESGNISLLIIVPSFREMVSSNTFEAITKLVAALLQNGIGVVVRTMQDADIALLRNIATTVWFDISTASHLLFVDDDMGFSPELVLDMLALDQPLVGVIAPVRSEPRAWACDPGLSGDPKAWPTIGDGKFLEVEYVGAGVMLIRRDVISGMLESFPGLSDTRHYNHKEEVIELGVHRLLRCFDQLDISDRARVSEDSSFCLRWGACGGKIYASIAHNIEHVGKKVYSGSYLDWYLGKLEHDTEGVYNKKGEAN